MTSIKLFHVTSIVEYQGCKGVAFCWHHGGGHHGGPPRPYAELIQGYDQLSDERSRSTVRMYIDELFTEQEAGQLKAYLDANYNGTTTIKQAKLPVSATNDYLPWAYSAYPMGGLADCWDGLDKGALPFRPYAYFDLSLIGTNEERWPSTVTAVAPSSSPAATTE